MPLDDRTRAPARRVLIAITDTERGGTPIQMATLARSVCARGCDVMVVSALPPGPVLRELREAGVQTATLAVHSKLGAWLAIPRLRSLIRAFRPDVVQTQLFHANLVGRLAAIGTGVPVV